MAGESRFQNIKAPYLTIEEQASEPDTPDAGHQRLYIDTADHVVKRKNSSGTVTVVGTGAVSDTAYDATSWNGVTTVAPSKNAVRDKIETMSAASTPASLKIYMSQSFR